jgi:hypothetical protein
LSAGFFFADAFFFFFATLVRFFFDLVLPAEAEAF